VGRPRRTLFQVLGWFVWKLLSLLGLRFAKERLKKAERARR
jgi:hypothetical protein